MRLPRSGAIASCSPRDLRLPPPNQRSRPATTATTSRLHAHHLCPPHKRAYPGSSCALSLLDARSDSASTLIDAYTDYQPRCLTSSDGSRSSPTRSPRTYPNAPRHALTLPTRHVHGVANMNCEAPIHRPLKASLCANGASRSGCWMTKATRSCPACSSGLRTIYIRHSRRTSKVGASCGSDSP
jgi:hypothetical protein